MGKSMVSGEDFPLVVNPLIDDFPVTTVKLQVLGGGLTGKNPGNDTGFFPQRTGKLSTALAASGKATRAFLKHGTCCQL